jgi:Uncharacterized proteins, LmbE homologs
VFISPHIDDAVWSCGGLLASQGKGSPALVLYLFSESGKETSERKKEEEKAAALLGYDFRFCGLRDFRQRDWSAVLSTRLHRPFDAKKDGKTLEALGQTISEILSSLEYQHVYYPLGVGRHLDHQLCFQVGSTQQHSGQVHFYEDLPYALAPGLLRSRLQEVLDPQDPAAGDLPEGGSEEELAALIEYLLARPTHQKPLHRRAKPAFRRFFRWWLSRQARKLPLGPLAPRRLVPEIHPLEAGWNLKLRGILAYESQVPVFFNTAAEAEQLLSSYHRRVEAGKIGYYERTWKKVA